MSIQISPFQLKRKEELRKKAIKLYKQGLSVREVAKVLGMSHGWVHLVVKEKLGEVRKLHLTEVDRT